VNTEPAFKSIPLDPAIVAMEQRWKDSGIGGLYDQSGPENRERARCIRAFLYPKPKLPTGRIEPITIPGPGGDIAARVVYPVNEPKGPAATLVYFHGGGWILGDMDSHEAHCIRLANATGAVVVNVEYRLAPEHPFPAGADDAIAATRWVHANLARLGGDAKRLAVGGDSAGGNFAAVVAVKCRDEGIPLAAQLLIYPATDLTGLNDPKVVGAYLGPNASSVCRDLRASPVLADLEGVAPAILGVGHYDFLYSDNMAYASALMAAGVALTLRVYPNLNHGFFSYTAISQASEQASEQLCADLKALLA
jgi:acetyl esterase